MAFSTCFLLVALSYIPSTCGDIRPRPLSWSANSYGPDGPWQAVAIQVGTPPQSINLYPGGAWESLILGSSVCNESSTCLAQNAGVYDRSKSSTAITVTAAGYVYNQTFDGTQNLTGSGSYTFDQMLVSPVEGYLTDTVPSFDMFVVDQAFSILADGTEYPAEVGNLALGAPVANQTFGSFNGTLITSYLYASGQTPSNSFGLHIGSAQLGIAGSLYLGGYDQLRIVGPVSAQSYTNAILQLDLLDIGIGVAEGGSPFPYTSKSGLLAQDSSSINGFIPVEADPKEPYLYLPVSTCQAIAQELPVTFQPKYGLYLWNTTDPRYQQIITSPSYLAFTFRANNSITQNFTINVPFALLNLTLRAPITDTPTPYFPCSLPRLPDYRLGRAFLQAAFVGMNWGVDYQGTWFLAQAPGPNIGLAPSVQSIAPTDDFIISSQNKWADSWSKTWTPLPGGTIIPTGTQSASPSASVPTIPTKSLAPGAIAGIAVGIVVVLALVSGVAWILLRRRGRKPEVAEREKNHPDQVIYFHPDQAIFFQQKPELELDGGPGPYGRSELPSHGHELPG